MDVEPAFPWLQGLDRASHKAALSDSKEGQGGGGGAEGDKVHRKGFAWSANSMGWMGHISELPPA